MSRVRDNSSDAVAAIAGRESASRGRQRHRRIVVKAGTNVLAGSRTDGGVDTDVMASLADQISLLAAVDGTQTLLVTSGAIAAGRQALAERVAVPAIPDIPTRQVLAALGQSRLMSTYAGLFEQQGIVCVPGAAHHQGHGAAAVVPEHPQYVAVPVGPGRPAHRE